MSDFSEYYASDKDALEYQAKIIFFKLALYACFAAYASGAINVIWMTLLTTVMVTRWMIAFHEIMHLKKPEALDLLSRCLPIPFAPFDLGYREYRAIHMKHHRHVATPDDPDAFHILGGVMKALFGALTQHEQSTVRYLRSNGMTRELAVMMLIRAVVFFGLLLAAPQAFLAWWLVLRLTYMVNDFVFFHLVHYRAGSAGSFPVPLPGVIVYPALLIYGTDVVYATMHHHIHHQQPRIAPKYLPLVAAIKEGCES